jgi:hypothetical protein
MAVRFRFLCGAASVLIAVVLSPLPVLGTAKKPETPAAAKATPPEAALKAYRRLNLY